MTVSLFEARRPAEQRDLQTEMARVWAQLDQMDKEAERQVLARVAELRADVLDRLAALPTATIDDQETFASTSLRAFAAELEDAANRFAQRYDLDLSAAMRQAAAYSDEAHRAALSQLARSMGVPPALISFSPLGLSEAQIEAAILFNNAAIKNVSQAVIQAVNREVQAVVFGAQSRWDAVRNIRAALSTAGGNLGALTQRALTIERTSLIAVFNIAAEHTYRQALDELPDLKVEWVTAKDKRVDPICVALNGVRKRPGEAFPGGYMAPPAHPRCRCRVVAWLPTWNPAPLVPMSAIK